MLGVNPLSQPRIPPRHDSSTSHPTHLSPRPNHPIPSSLLTQLISLLTQLKHPQLTGAFPQLDRWGDFWSDLLVQPCMCIQCGHALCGRMAHENRRARGINVISLKAGPCAHTEKNTTDLLYSSPCVRGHVRGSTHVHAQATRRTVSERDPPIVRGINKPR